MQSKIDTTYLKGIWKLIFIEIFPHLIVCSFLTLFKPEQVLYIFLMGLVFPDFLVFFYKIFYKLRYARVEKIVNLFHVVVLLASFVFLFLGYPLVFLAGISHLFLDLLGW